MIHSSVAALLMSTPAPPPGTADTIIAFFFICFAIYKAVRLVKTTRLGWSFAFYNLVLAALFSLAIFVLPHTNYPVRVDGAILTIARAALLVAIIWCVVEVELSRKEMREIMGNPRIGHGQQT